MSKQKRIQSMLTQLYSIHQQLFGQKYSIGLLLDQNSEFNQIIQQFREIIFTIKSAQEEREKKQNSKNYKVTPERVRVNYQIRQNTQKAQEVLAQAASRLRTGANQPKVIQNRQKQLKSCYDLLQDVKQSQNGGVYKPPEIMSFQQIKKKLINRDNGDEQANEEVNMDEEVAIDKFNQKDKQMDVVLDQIINVNRGFRNKMKTANQTIDQTTNKIRSLNKKAEKLTVRVKKADKDLAEILKTYQRPSQLCLNVTLILMVLALIAVIINLIKGQTV